MQSHLWMHHRRKRSDGTPPYRWECPYCGATGVEYVQTDGNALKNHLTEHVPSVFDTVSTSDLVHPGGRLLLYTGGGGTAATVMRKHVFFDADSLLLVTATPDKQLELLSEIPFPPVRTAVLTTASPPYEYADATGGQVDVIQLEGGIGLTELARESSDVIEDYGDRGGTFHIEFDIAGAIIERFGLESAFKFISALNAWIHRAEAGIYYPVSSSKQPKSVLNALDGLFDRSIRAREKRLVSSFN